MGSWGTGHFRRKATRAALLLGVGSAWVLAGLLLWRTTVPGDLRRPHVDAQRYWSSSVLHRAARFDGFLRWEWVIATLVELLALLALVRLGPRIARAFELGRIGTGVMVGAVTTLALWLVGLPFGLVTLWWGRRYGIEKESYLDWLLGLWPGALGKVVGLTIVLTLLLVLAGRFRRRWWLVAGPLFVAVAALLAFLLPYVQTIGTHGLSRPRLAAAVGALAQREGVSGTPVRVEKVSDTTSAVNAESIGIGRSARVVIWDTFLAPRFTAGEIEVVAAHELGHAARRHILKGLAWSALITIPGFFVLAVATGRRGGMARPEVVPFALLVIGLLNLGVTPFTNVISRRYEGEADWRALQTTHDPASAARLFRDFGSVDLQQPDPPGWSYVWIDDHPTLVQRIAMVRAWARLHGSSGG
ncbi:MAG: M48 family metalloprotease [Gaiellaceae bacterium]